MWTVGNPSAIGPITHIVRKRGGGTGPTSFSGAIGLHHNNIVLRESGQLIMHSSILSFNHSFYDSFIL